MCLCMCMCSGRVVNKIRVRKRPILAGVRDLQLSCGLGDPKVGDMATLQHVLKGTKSTQAKMGHQPRPRLPITPVILGKLRLVWEKTRHDYNSIMLWAACTTAFLVSLGQGRLQLLQHTFLTPRTTLL